MIRSRDAFHELMEECRGGTAVACGRRSCSGARQWGGRRANLNRGVVFKLREPCVWDQ